MTTVLWKYELSLKKKGGMQRTYSVLRNYFLIDGIIMRPDFGKPIARPCTHITGFQEIQI